MPSRRFFADRRVLITGAAGSIGAALAQQLASLGCKTLILADHYDHGLIEVCETISAAHRAPEIIDLLCDIRDRNRLLKQFENARPDIVIHSAALKHVPLGERHPGECVLTNLIGVRNALDAALSANAQDFVFVSSDKAAAPHSVMGACKRAAELYLWGRGVATQARLTALRFANVVGSRGSVGPRFLERIAKGQDLEVTDPAMERHFITVGEAVRLICRVAADAEAPGGAYFLEPGPPVRILEFAQRLIAQKGSSAGIVFVGPRVGEKLNERLYDEYETAVRTEIEGVWRIARRSPRAVLSDADLDMFEAMARRDDVQLRNRLLAQITARVEAPVTQVAL